MTDLSSSAAAPEQDDLAADVKQRMCTIIDALVDGSAESAQSDFEHVLIRARELIERKQRLQATKSETKDLIGEVLFSRLRRQFTEFAETGEAREPLRVAEWLIGALLGTQALGEFSAAFDCAMLDAATPRDYSFAGMTDFINIEEVMQLLGAGKHTGRLTLENEDNRIDVYLHDGHVAFLDPHKMARRVLPGANPMNYREISREQMEEAEQQHRGGTPLFQALADLDCFRGLELCTVFRQLGCEVLHEFLRDQDSCRFFYRRMDELPDFAIEHDLRLRITPILLEGSKRLDDWRSLTNVFPDPKAPVDPVEDMYAKISQLNLGVLEIKLLSLIDGENSPNDLVDVLGLPLPEVYQWLVKFAREGAIVPPGGFESLHDISMSVEESMEMAFEALDANDDQLALNSALDKVLGDEDDDGLGSGLDLGFLSAAHDDDEE